MRRLVPAVVMLSLVLAGCKAKEAIDKASIASDLHKKGTIDLMKEVSEDTYEPPADGKLSDAQVQMYLKVREKEVAIAQVAREEAKKHAAAAEKAGEKSLSGMMAGLKTLGSAADMFTADIRAAKELGFNTQEYLWVKGQVLAASTSAMGEKMQESLAAQMDSAHAQMKKSYDEATDDQTRAMYKQMLDGYEQSKKEMAASQEQQEPDVKHNRQLLAKYENALNAFATELAKWEDKPGEAQKSVDQWQKDVDKATAEARQQQ